MRRIAALLVAAATAGSIAGCAGGVRSIDVTLVTKPPLAVEVTSSRIVVPEGIGVGVEILGRDVDGEEVEVDCQYFGADRGITAAVVGHSGCIVRGNVVGVYEMIVTDFHNDLPVTVEVVPQ
jgi:hypothetical protein